MPAQRLSMRKLRDILRLKLQSDLSIRQINRIGYLRPALRFFHIAGFCFNPFIAFSGGFFFPKWRLGF